MKKLFYLALTFTLLFTGCSQAENNSETVTSTDSNVATESLMDTDETIKNMPDTSDTSADNTKAGEIAGDVIEIKENLFIAQTNDIYLNTEDYLGKTIKYEGLFKYFPSEDEVNTYYYVIRYGPGCCGYDSTAGFEVIWNGEYPEQDEWVEAIGVLETYEENGRPYLRLQLTSLTVLEERGVEYVAT